MVKASQDIVIPDDVKMEVKARKIRVTGPRGKAPCVLHGVCKDSYVSAAEIVYGETHSVLAAVVFIRCLYTWDTLANRYFDQRLQALGS